MTGGLLQLVAVGIDSIFLTSNPSITLFKTVYRRYTNFSLTTRTKQIKNLVDFDKEGYYILQKEADCIHKIWLDFNISNLKLSYGTPTREHINEICSKYGFTINYQTDGSNNTIVTPNEYNYIIDEINKFIQNEVDKNNKIIDLIILNNEYNNDININTQKEDIIKKFKLKLDELFNSYYGEVFDSSGNVKSTKHSSNQGQNIPFCPFNVFVKLLTLKMIFAQQNLISDSSNLNEDIINDYYYLDHDFYTNPEYTLGLIYGYKHGDKVNNVYTYAINRDLETDYINNSNKHNITKFAINDLDKYIRECLLMENNKNIFLYKSDENNINNIKMYHNKFIDVLNNILSKNLFYIILGYNPNNITTLEFGRLYYLLSLLKYLNTTIDTINYNLQNQIYLKIQYKNLIDLIYYELIKTYNKIYNLYYNDDIFKSTIEITSNIIEQTGLIIYDYYNLANYILSMIIDSNQNNTVYNNLYYHEESKFFNMFTKNNIIDITNIQYKFDLEQILRTYLIDLINTQTKDDKLYNIDNINDILYNEYLKELTYNLIGTQMYFSDALGITSDNNYYFLYRDQNNNIYTQNSDGTYFMYLQKLYQCMLLLHIIESNIPNNLNYVDNSGNYMGNLSDISKYYGYKMIDYFNNIINLQNNPYIPILNFNNNPDSTVQSIDIDVYKILNKFLKSSDIIYDSNSFSQNFIKSLTQTLRQNQYANIEIFYTTILNSILCPAHHNIAIKTTSIINFNNIYDMQNDYYKFIFYKTYTNNISDTNRFSSIMNSKISGLNDNIIYLFNKYVKNENEIYFANEILNNITEFNNNIQAIYESDFLIDYFNDFSLWKDLLLNSDKTKNILENLSFDESGNIVSLKYYFDNVNSTIKVRIPSGNDYIDPDYNIYKKFIDPLNTVIKNNMICLNYTPLHLIKDVFTNIYNYISNYNYVNNNINFSLSQAELYLFDFRDFEEYNPTNVPTNYFNTIKNNIDFKNDLYRTFILNVLLKVNNQSNINNTDNFQTQIFEQDLFKIADYEYLTSYANNYLNSNKIALFGLLRPENLIDINKDFSTNVDIYTLQTDVNGNIMYDTSGNPIQIKTNTKLFAPLIRGIIERIRIKLISIIYTNLVTSFQNISNQEIQNICDDILNNLNIILDNYIVYDNINNTDLDKYSYSTYRNNGYIYNILSNNSSNSVQTIISQILNNNTNTYTFTNTTQNYIYAPSSIWSYINKMQIRQYNKLFNETLISPEYYHNNLGSFMMNVYFEFKFRLMNINQVNYKYLPRFFQTDYSKYYYSYNVNFSTNTIECNQDYNIYENYKTNKFYGIENQSNLSYPVESYGFDYYAIGDFGEFNIINNIYTYKVTSLDFSTIFNPLTQTNTLIDWYYTINSLMLSIDMKESNLNGTETYYPYNFYLQQISFNDQLNTITLNTLPKFNQTYIAKMTPYYSNLMRIRNKYRDPAIAKLSLSEIIDYFNDYTNGVYKYYSTAEQTIAERVKNRLLNGNYITVKQNISSIFDYIEQFTDLSQNPILPINNQQFQYMQDIDNSGIPISISNPYDSPSHDYFDEFVNYDSDRKNNVKNYASSLVEILLENINSNIGENFFNGFKQKSDFIKFMIYLIMKDINTNDLDTPFVSDIINLNINLYDEMIANTYADYKLNYFNTIKNITIPRSSNITITNDDKIKFSYDLPFIDLLYHIPDYYTQTDILYYGSELDKWLRNVIYQNPVKYCWVRELGYYLLEYCNFYLDQLLIDGYNSNLLSLLDKINGIEDYKHGINILNGNTEYNITYNELDKSNVNIRIPLKFYFCKDVALSIPMINLLYTKAIIKFKTRKIEDLLIYDEKALIIKKPKIKCSATIQYIYLEEEERKRISQSKMEFLIEKFRYCGIYKYNKTNLIDNKIITKLQISDPTKYILWRIKIIYENNMQNNYTWNINGYLDENYNPQKITESIKIYFNGSSREQGESELFNLINPHMRCVGSLDEDEYMYIFALYPLLYQPSGSANMTNIEDVIIEHKFNTFFLSELDKKGLNFEIEYWALGYNVLRYMSGMCAPIFYI